MALPNLEELEAIKELRSRVEDVLSEEELNDDMFLLRWIRAREMDLDKAEAMLRNALKWREDKKVDSVLERKIEPYFFEKFPRWIDALDLIGRPVMTFNFGVWDTRVIGKDGKKPEDFMDYITEGFELILKRMKESNEHLKSQNNPNSVHQFIAIFDFEGFIYGQLFNFKAVQTLLQMGSIYEAYYPEILHSAYFINCPRFISTVLSLLRPILAPKTMAKITCFPSGGEWKNEILKIISAKQLRPQFGGTMGLIGSDS